MNSVRWGCENSFNLAGSHCSIAEQNLLLTDSTGGRGSALLSLLTSGPQEGQVLRFHHSPGVGENFLVIIPTGQYLTKLCQNNMKLKYHYKKQLINANIFSDPKSRVHKMEVDILASGSSRFNLKHLYRCLLLFCLVVIDLPYLPYCIFKYDWYRRRSVGDPLSIPRPV